jgi:hypothetical protein
MRFRHATSVRVSVSAQTGHHCLDMDDDPQQRDALTVQHLEHQDAGDPVPGVEG